MGRILIRFNEDQVSEPIASQIIIEYKVPMAILSAHINSKGGEILAEVPDAILEKVVNAFRQRGVSVTVPKLIAVSYTHLRAHETGRNLVCRLLLEKKKKHK